MKHSYHVTQQFVYTQEMKTYVHAELYMDIVTFNNKIASYFTSKGRLIQE